jgi:arsenite methyltransferase
MLKETTMTNDKNLTNREDVREVVRQRYGDAALRVMAGESGSCCGGEEACCSTTDPITSDHYSATEASLIPEAALLASLGCGNPTALAELQPGEIVLDLGSGGGIDVLLSARRVGPDGFAYGLDMTDAMLELAERNRRQAGADNVKFLKGHIEEIPLPDASVDVIVSNCVINLSADKDAVLKEAFRVLKPGGRFAVSDVVVDGVIPVAVRHDMEAYVGCVAGALERDEYAQKLERAGFEGVGIEPTRRYRFADLEGSTIAAEAIANLSPEEREELDGKVMGAFIRATKPAASKRHVQVFDPAMCCSTGVCGPAVDPNLVRAARDFAWLKHQPGVEVERYNLGQQPQAFIDNQVVHAELRANLRALPIVLIDGVIVAQGSYPSREELCEWLGIAPPQEGLTVLGR